MKISSKWFIDLNVKHKTINILEKKLGENQHLELGKGYLDLTLKP
jgi:hypothetical protein